MMDSGILIEYLIHTQTLNGGLAQLARAPALHAGGQRFESVILHILENTSNYCLSNSN